ncbi:MAG: hypothetical protein WC828_01985 [Thermoleophilia bacterium]|jgi:hypothetical protein
MSNVRIIDLDRNDEAAVRQTAALIFDVFKHMSPLWLPDIFMAKRI